MTIKQNISKHTFPHAAPADDDGPAIIIIILLQIPSSSSVLFQQTIDRDSHFPHDERAVSHRIVIFLLIRITRIAISFPDEILPTLTNNFLDADWRRARRKRRRTKYNSIQHHPEEKRDLKMRQKETSRITSRVGTGKKERRKRSWGSENEKKKNDISKSDEEDTRNRRRRRREECARMRRTKEGIKRWTKKA